MVHDIWFTNKWFMDKWFKMKQLYLHLLCSASSGSFNENISVSRNCIDETTWYHKWKLDIVKITMWVEAQFLQKLLPKLKLDLCKELFLYGSWIYHGLSNAMYLRRWKHSYNSVPCIIKNSLHQSNFYFTSLIVNHFVMTLVNPTYLS